MCWGLTLNKATLVARVRKETKVRHTLHIGGFAHFVGAASLRDAAMLEGLDCVITNRIVFGQMLGLDVTRWQTQLAALRPMVERPAVARSLEPRVVRSRSNQRSLYRPRRNRDD